MDMIHRLLAGCRATSAAERRWPADLLRSPPLPRVLRVISPIVRFASLLELGFR